MIVFTIKGERPPIKGQSMGILETWAWVPNRALAMKLSGEDAYFRRPPGQLCACVFIPREASDREPQ